MTAEAMEAGPEEGSAADGDRPLRIALLTYKGNPFCGGQGVYVRHLSRELARLGHRVEVIGAQPYPVLDEDVLGADEGRAGSGAGADSGGSPSPSCPASTSTASPTPSAPRSAASTATGSTRSRSARCGPAASPSR